MNVFMLMYVYSLHIIRIILLLNLLEEKVKNNLQELRVT